MNITINEDFSSVTMSEDGKKEMRLPNYDPVDHDKLLTSEEDVQALIQKHSKNPKMWSDVIEVNPEYRSLTFVEFIELVQQAGQMTDEKAIEILATSTKPSIVLLRMKLEKADAIARDNASVLRGLDTLVSESYINDAGKAAILKHWPKA